MGDLSVIFYFLRRKIMFKNYYKKSKHRVLRKTEVDTYGPPVFAPDYSITDERTPKETMEQC